MKRFLFSLPCAMALGCVALPPPLPADRDPANSKAAEAPAPVSSATLTDAVKDARKSTSPPPMDMSDGGSMQGMQMDGSPAAAATADAGSPAPASGGHHQHARPAAVRAADAGAP